MHFRAFYFSSSPLPRLQLLCGFKISGYSLSLKFPEGEVVMRFQLTDGKVHLGLEVCMSIGNSVNGYSVFSFFISTTRTLVPVPLKDSFFQKPLLYSSVIVHSHYSIRLNLPLNEKEDFSLYCKRQHILVFRVCGPRPLQS